MNVKKLHCIWLLLVPLPTLASLSKSYNIEVIYDDIGTTPIHVSSFDSQNAYITANNRLEVHTDNEAYIGKSVEYLGGGNQQYAYVRGYSHFPLTLRGVRHGYEFTINNSLYDSYLRVEGITITGHWFAQYFNDGCTTVRPTDYMQTELMIRNEPSLDCKARSFDIGASIGGFIAGGRQFYQLSWDQDLKTLLSNPNIPNDVYIGTATYNGDYLVSRVAPNPKKANYTFNLKIVKKPTLTRLAFANNDLNFNVVQHGNTFTGTATTGFTLNGYFDKKQKINFSLSSANSHNSKLSMKGTTTGNYLPYSVRLSNMAGDNVIYNENNKLKTLSTLDENILQGTLDFKFNQKNIVSDSYHDVLTVIASLVL
ncbi:hypothetical protein VP758_004969 [Vibrio harveyi]|nr:hypothetical protein [Vibrio harveyi]